MKNYKYFFLLRNLDKREQEHSERVSLYSWNFGHALNLNKEELKKLSILALLHDIGKSRVKRSILNKPGPLNEYERKNIEKHSIFGEKYILTIPELKNYSNVVKSHHEKWDGKGYPDMISGENIPFLSRIISIADTYDALTNKRPYRGKVYSTTEALKIIANEAGTKFDPQLSKIFAKNINNIINSYKPIEKAVLSR